MDKRVFPIKEDEQIQWSSNEQFTDRISDSTRKLTSEKPSFIVFGVIVSKDTDKAVTLLSLPRMGEQESRDSWTTLTKSAHPAETGHRSEQGT